MFSWQTQHGDGHGRHHATLHFYKGGHKTSEINKIETGKKIRKLREVESETQADLAILLEVKRQIISYYENGTRVPTLEHLIYIADHYNTTTDYLLGISDIPRPTPLSDDEIILLVSEYTNLSANMVKALHENKEALPNALNALFKIFK